jgi:adenylate kinase
MSAHGPRLVLLGKQGAGKGTQAARLAEHFGTEHFSTGELFRAAAAEGTPAGLDAKRYMDEGELVPDDTVIRLVEERFAEGGPLNDGFVLDGFPRKLPQAQALERVLNGRPVELALDVDVPTEIVLDRIAGRRVCTECGRTYHINLPPKVKWICDTCGGTVVQRDDDTEEAVARRLDIYERQTVPIIEFYRELGKLVVVDGIGDGDVVFDRLLKEIEGRLGDGSR